LISSIDFSEFVCIFIHFVVVVIVEKAPVKSSRLFAQGEMGFPALSFKEDK